MRPFEDAQDQAAQEPEVVETEVQRLRRQLHELTNPGWLASPEQIISAALVLNEKMLKDQRKYEVQRYEEISELRHRNAELEARITEQAATILDLQDAQKDLVTSSKALVVVTDLFMEGVAPKELFESSVDMFAEIVETYPGGEF